MGMIYPCSRCGAPLADDARSGLYPVCLPCSAVLVAEQVDGGAANNREAKDEFWSYDFTLLHAAVWPPRFLDGYTWLVDGACVPSHMIGAGKADTRAEAIRAACEFAATTFERLAGEARALRAQQEE